MNRDNRAVTTIIVIALLILAANMTTGCATVMKEVTGPDGYGYKERIRAFGGGNIEKAAQSFGGTLKVFNPDGSPLVEVIMQSEMESEGMTSDMEAILAGMGFLIKMGTIMVPVP